MIRIPGISTFSSRTRTALRGFVASCLRAVVGTRLIWLLPCVIAPPMILAAELSGWEVLLFPEALSLAFLVWAERRPEVNGCRWRIAVMPVVCATLGIAATNIAAPRWLVALAVMGVALLILQLTRTRIAPAMSAAVLPVIFGEHGFAYLITVSTVSTLLAVTARATVASPAERQAASAVMAPGRRTGWPWPRVVAFWIIGSLWLTLACGLCALPPMAAAPPLLVACLEFSIGAPTAGAGLRRVVFLTVSGFLGGMACQYIGHEWLAGTLAVAAVTLGAILVNQSLPPAMAVAIVPIVAGSHNAVHAGLSVGLGAAALHLMVWLWLRGGPGMTLVARSLAGKLRRVDVVPHALPE